MEKRKENRKGIIEHSRQLQARLAASKLAESSEEDEEEDEVYMRSVEVISSRGGGTSTGADVKLTELGNRQEALQVQVANIRGTLEADFDSMMNILIQPHQDAIDFSDYSEGSLNLRIDYTYTLPRETIARDLQRLLDDLCGGNASGRSGVLLSPGRSQHHRNVISGTANGVSHT